MKLTLFLFLTALLPLSGAAQYLQVIPEKTADNCQVRSDVMEKWLLDWPNLKRYQQNDEDNDEESEHVDSKVSSPLITFVAWKMIRVGAECFLCGEFE